MFFSYLKDHVGKFSYLVHKITKKRPREIEGTEKPSVGCLFKKNGTYVVKNLHISNLLCNFAR